jgi:7,8-dihydropterin-6-yl-methyl-4-(beta-D-ribofuranosyl)aminobenzene 5'-phosphate synthase
MSQPNGKLITLRCMVDNSALFGSALWGEHGVAFSIETSQGNLLFDSGQSGDVLLHNAALMEIDLGRFDALVLSHAHYDHTGGLERFFSLSRPGIPLYASPDLFRERYSLKDGKAHSIGLRLSQDSIAGQTRLCLSTEPVEIMPGIWTTGEITERKEFVGGSSYLNIRVGESWQPDPYQDDFSLVMQTSRGLVVVCGCCHAGLLNTLTHVRRFFSQPIRAIIGGTHLVSAGPEILGHVVEVLREQGNGNIPDLYLNHCTGERALAILMQAFGEKVRSCPAGTLLTFD